MRRPVQNKNEGIRINIEQRYFLEDTLSRQGKVKVCKEGSLRQKGTSALSQLALYYNASPHIVLHGCQMSLKPV